MADINSEKLELRQTFKKKRSELSHENVAKKSQAITQNFLTKLLPQIYSKNSDKVFGIYASSGGEVSTNLIIEYFQKNHIPFSYPKITQLNHCLDFILAQPDQTFAANQFYPKILEPINGIKNFPDFIILPLLAFDEHSSRLGMGGGFFDRTIDFLKTQKTEIITIGLAYEFQRSHDPLPIEKTDQKLDFIVTELEVFPRERDVR